MEQKQLIIAALGAAVLALLTGKTFKRLLLLPFKLIASRTATKEDDLIVHEAAKDFGLPEDASKPVDSENKP